MADHRARRAHKYEPVPNAEAFNAGKQWHNELRQLNAKQGLVRTVFGECRVGIDGSICPMTLVACRYGGVYEHGRFAAFPVDVDALPEGLNDGDRECDEFWTNAREREHEIGVGDTPNEAYEDLLRRLRGE